MKTLKIIFEIIVIAFLVFALVVLFDSVLNDYFFESYNPIWYLTLIGFGLLVSGLNFVINKTFRNIIWIFLLLLLGVISLIITFTHDY